MADSQPVLHARTEKGERITLRAHRVADAEAIVAACTDPATLEWTNLPDEYDRARALKLIAKARELWERGEGARWVIADAEDECVGIIDLHINAGDRQAGEFFFVAAPSARGKGYTTAALRVVAEWALREHGLERVEWQALVGNHGSRRVAEKAGFRYEGTLRLRCPQRGRRYDSWVASLIRDDLVRAT